MGSVPLWPRILPVISELLYNIEVQINFNYTEISKRQLSMRDVLITIFAEFLYFQIC